VIARLTFAAPLVYSSRGTSSIAKKSRALRDRIKRGDEDLFRQIAEHVGELVRDGRFPGFLGDDVLLVPVPGHAPLARGARNNASRIASALIAEKLAHEMADSLVRARPVAKSAFAKPADRPRAADHFHSLEMARSLLPPRRILLVDDFVTRGATLIGAASRVQEVFPGVEVRAFPLVRSITDGDIPTIREPCVGTVELDADGECRRRP
jgi:glutamine phosphoribosylpyrophosphate amidotransferase